MELTIPKLSLVVLIGPSGSGKSTFARKHFLETEVLSSDNCRALVSDDENDQGATGPAFEVLHFIARKRLAAGKLTVIDATNVQKEARKPLVDLAREFHALPVAIVFDLPGKLCHARNKDRTDRNFGSHVIRQQISQMRRSAKGLKYEGFRHIFKLGSEEEVDSATISRVPLWNDRRELKGPFDIIGDVHGCYDELVELLGQLGYVHSENASEGSIPGPVYSHPDGRTAVFLGDIVDRGPAIVECIRLVYNMVKAGNAMCVPGNHEAKLLRKLRGKDVRLTHGLADSLEQIEGIRGDEGDEFRKELINFLDGLISHYVLDGGRLVVSHAGLKEEMHGRGSGKVREFCLYGETSGETDDFGLPVRYDWAAQYRGAAHVVCGHTPVPNSEWLNRTTNIDTGCVFGGHLTALRYPEKEFITVAAKMMYAEPARPLDTGNNVERLSAQHLHDDILDAEDVLGKRLVTTRLRSSVTIRRENAAAALEVMSRFAVNPKWLIYLPPTMSPSETSGREGYLEYPEEAFSYYRANGVPRVICEEKHMGSRAVAVICRDEQTALKRFGISDEGTGIIFTRTGRRFFNNQTVEAELITRIRQAFDTTGFWDEFGTGWVCLDCEIMPWSEKAQELIKSQYAAVGTAARISLESVVDALIKTRTREDLETGFELPPESDAGELDIEKLYEKCNDRRDAVSRYVDSYRQYCWPVNTIDDLKVAPFHILAVEGRAFIDRNHDWHMKSITKICEADKNILLATANMLVDVTDENELQGAALWWEKLTEHGGEGMVVKPLEFVARGKRGLIQPALKCRGKEYLRIIYGPEYTLDDNLQRLRSRALGAKRSLALREFALGVEALERFVRKEPLRRVHECVFGVLALESEPVDPRL